MKREILVKETAADHWLSRGVMVDLYWLESQAGDGVVLEKDIYISILTII